MYSFFFHGVFFVAEFSQATFCLVVWHKLGSCKSRSCHSARRHGTCCVCWVTFVESFIVKFTRCSVNSMAERRRFLIGDGKPRATIEVKCIPPLPSSFHISVLTRRVLTGRLILISHRGYPSCHSVPRSCFCCRSSVTGITPCPLALLARPSNEICMPCSQTAQSSTPFGSTDEDGYVTPDRLKQTPKGDFSNDYWCSAVMPFSFRRNVDSVECASQIVSKFEQRSNSGNDGKRKNLHWSRPFHAHQVTLRT